MWKFSLIFVVVIVVLLVGLMKVGSSVSGTWVGQLNGRDAMIVLSSNHTGTIQFSSFAGMQVSEFVWLTRGNELVFDPRRSNETGIRELSGKYKIDGDKLTIHHSGHGTAVYERLPRN